MSLAGTSSEDFDTPQGLATSSLIQYYSVLLGLNITYGCSPNTYAIIKQLIIKTVNINNKTTNNKNINGSIYELKNKS